MANGQKGLVTTAAYEQLGGRVRAKEEKEECKRRSGAQKRANCTIQFESEAAAAAAAVLCGIYCLLRSSEFWLLLLHGCCFPQANGPSL